MVRNVRFSFRIQNFEQRLAIEYKALSPTAVSQCFCCWFRTMLTIQKSPRRLNVLATIQYVLITGNNYSRTKLAFEARVDSHPSVPTRWQTPLRNLSSASNRETTPSLKRKRNVVNDEDDFDVDDLFEETDEGHVMVDVDTGGESEGESVAVESDEGGLFVAKKETRAASRATTHQLAMMVQNNMKRL